ncbi:MAG: IS200/IS605 family transposase [Chthonomonadales bacterium]|nr:IS200/IS605 family transposase [Chthonomonadales bacterium]
MSQSYIRCLVHLVWSTHNRVPVISPDVRGRLHAYLGGVVRTAGAHAHVIGGTDDHVHLLLSLTATKTIMEIVRAAKGVSSRWMHENGVPEFRWQDGYGAFSVAAEAQERVEAYIRRQEEHHRVVSFQEEFLEFLRRNNVEYDPRYIWT